MQMSKERAEHHKILQEKSKPVCPKGHGACSNLVNFTRAYLPVERELPTNTRQKSLIEV